MIKNGVLSIGPNELPESETGKQLSALAEQDHLQAILQGKSEYVRQAAQKQGIPITHVRSQTVTIGEFIEVNGELALAEAIKNGRWIIVDELDFPSAEAILIANENLP